MFRLAALAALITLALVIGPALAGGGSVARATTSDGDVVLGLSAYGGCSVGNDANCANAETGIYNASGNAFEADSSGGTGLIGSSSGGDGVDGFSISGDGVYGQGNDAGSYGVEGNNANGYGVYATSESNYALYADGTGASAGHMQTESRYGAALELNIYNANNGRGALEASTNGTGQAVLATTTGSGPGVRGVSTTSGAGIAGVEGTSTNGPGLSGIAGTGASSTALQTTGRASLSGPTTLSGSTIFKGSTSFARSGKLSIAANNAQVTKTGIALTSASIVEATIQGNVAGVYVQGVTMVTGASGSFTIHLNKATPTALTVGWLIAN